MTLVKDINELLAVLNKRSNKCISENEKQSISIANAGESIYGILQCCPCPPVDVLHRLVIQLLFLVPKDDVEVVYAALKIILVMPTIVDQYLLAKLSPWVEEVYNSVIVEHPQP